jgi:transposase-like protein
MIQPGDVYCPFCGDMNVGFDFTSEHAFWFCDRCSRQWSWDHDGVDWIWPDTVRKTSPGCPWCGTQNIRGGVVRTGRHTNWMCMRAPCGRRWTGFWTQPHRWTIRIPVSQVPFTWIAPRDGVYQARWTYTPLIGPPTGETR